MRLSDSGKIMPGSMTAQFSLLTIPSPQRFCSLWLFLPKGIAKHIQEMVRICTCKACYEFITVLNKFCVVVMKIRI